MAMDMGWNVFLCYTDMCYKSMYIVGLMYDYVNERNKEKTDSGVK